MSSAATAAVTIRWAWEADEPCLVEIDEATWRLYAAAGFETEGVLADELFLEGRTVDDHRLARRFDP